MATADAAESVDGRIESRDDVRRWLGWFALAVIVGMQAGTIFKPLGALGETRVADWIDLLTPYAVVGCAAAVLHRVSAGLGHWTLFGVGAVTFTLGHGLHLSANSVSNADHPVLKEADIVHLWDEVASHYIWYTGLFVVLAALAQALRTVEIRLGPPGVVVTVLFTVTLVNTYIEGGVPWLGIGFFVAGAVAAWTWRPDPIAGQLRIIAALGLVLMCSWGVAWAIVDGSVFPEFSDVGWI